MTVTFPLVFNQFVLRIQSLAILTHHPKQIERKENINYRLMTFAKVRKDVITQSRMFHFLAMLTVAVYQGKVKGW